VKIRDGLREADAAFQSTPLPPQTLASLRRRVLAERRSAAWWLLVPAAAALAALIVFVLWPNVPEVEDVTLAAQQTYLPDLPRGVTVVAAVGSRLHREHDRVRVLSGEVTFSVDKRHSGEAPVRIDVSHGTIEVVGTRFTIRQRELGGDVALHEGVIRFGDKTLQAGESLQWPEPAPLPVVKAPTPPPDVAPAPTPSPTPPAPQAERRMSARPRHEPAVIHETDAAWLLEEVALLRSRSEYGEAVRLLQKGIGGLVLPATRERFSYELGSILTYQLNDAGGACAQWARHTAAFPTGRYAREVKSAQQRLQCEP
jgi:transmembrane sensor